jgi:hypothetical protein
MAVHPVEGEVEDERGELLGGMPRLEPIGDIVLRPEVRTCVRRVGLPAKWKDAHRERATGLSAAATCMEWSQPGNTGRPSLCHWSDSSLFLACGSLSGVMTVLAPAK